MRADGVRGEYEAAVQRDASATELQLINSPTTATSDRVSVLQQYGFAGLLGGASVGVLLALLLDGWRRRRAMRRM
jgi:hypothetical protein